MRSGGFQRCGMVQQRSCHAAGACWTGTTFFDWAHILSVPAQSCVLRQSGGAAPAVNKLTKVERALRCQSHPETCCPCGKDTIRLVDVLVPDIMAVWERTDHVYAERDTDQKIWGLDWVVEKLLLRNENSHLLRNRCPWNSVALLQLFSRDAIFPFMKHSRSSGSLSAHCLILGFLDKGHGTRGRLAYILQNISVTIHISVEASKAGVFVHYLSPHRH